MCLLYKKYSHIIISTLTILALASIIIIIQSKGSKPYPLPNFFYFPSSSYWTQQPIASKSSHGTTSSPSSSSSSSSPPPSSPSTSTSSSTSLSPLSDSLAHYLAVINNSSSLSKSEEKKQRTVLKLRDEIEKVLIVGRKKDKKTEKKEYELGKARALIKQAFQSRNISIIGEDDDAGSVERLSHGIGYNIYKNTFAFHRSYKLMEKMFKIYIYEEGEPPLFHEGPCKSIYSMEGIFMGLIEKKNQFRTYDPNEAHVYNLPFSVAMIIQHLFDPIIRDKAVLERTILDYVSIISHKYPYWNRSLGADHFMLSCHDWGPRATWYHPLLYFNSIRALCNANTSENFNPRKDLSIPEINLKSPNKFPEIMHGSPLSKRTVLAFFAGRMHGRIRPLLLNYWKDKNDPEFQVYEQLPNEISYQEMMKKSKYCLCPSGYEVASPRVAEAIYAECVPVLISQNYIPPFSDVLDWTKFSVQVSVSEIPKLKNILMEIPYEKYVELHQGVRQVQHHFVMNDHPKRFDVFHMIIHSLWLRRLNVRIFT